MALRVGVSNGKSPPCSPSPGQVGYNVFNLSRDLTTPRDKLQQIIDYEWHLLKRYITTLTSLVAIGTVIWEI